MALGRSASPFRELPPRLVAVDVERQRLALIEDGRTIAEYPVSTAVTGVGGESGSHRTPPGWHRIHARIGEGAAAGTEFRSRVPTGRVWRGEPADEDLILTRILTLDGLEPGVNRGPGLDSLERYIYIHGTNHEAAVGRADSHGCIRMRNADVVDLFERVREGDAVLVLAGPPGATAVAGDAHAAQSSEPANVPNAAAAAAAHESAAPIPDPRTAGRFHYAGIGGSGMSALAQFQAMIGGRASGSDRSFDRGERPEARAQLERLGVAIHAQDGSGIAGDCAALVISTAVESQVPDVAAARARGTRVLHRSELLAHFVDTFRTIAVTGTSGKSTAVAMVFEILRGAGRRPSVITGGDLLALQAEGLWGNAWFGGSDLLVVEADESDGSVVRYHPAVGVILNLQRDHKEPEEVARMFTRFRAQAREAFVVAEDENLAAFAAGADVFGTGPRATTRGAELALDGRGSGFEVDGIAFRLPVPGAHNVHNALSAIAACRTVGVPLGDMVAPLAGFRGVGRRFQSLGSARGVEVVDDFAHNAAKISAAIDTAHRRARRVLAIYQPHGYGPTRFLWQDFVDAFSGSLAADDKLWMLEVFYAGGTALRDFSSADIVADIAARGTAAEYAASREELARRVAAEARDGDLVLIMGARDPSLTTLGRDLLAALSGSSTAAATRAGATRA